MRAVAPTLAATAPRAHLPTRRRAPNRGATRPRATPQMESSSSSEGAAKVADGEEDASPSPPSSSVASNAHGTPRWREFTLAFTGAWRGRCVEFDADGCALDIPIRYVHGVGRVPRANMPFADTDNDWVTRCDCVSTEDGVRLQAQRAMPEIGNEDAISSCGASEWNDGAELLVADEEVRILRGYVYFYFYFCIGNQYDVVFFLLTGRVKIKRCCRTAPSPRARDDCPPRMMMMMMASRPCTSAWRTRAIPTDEFASFRGCDWTPQLREIIFIRCNRATSGWRRGLSVAHAGSARIRGRT